MHLRRLGAILVATVGLVAGVLTPAAASAETTTSAVTVVHGIQGVPVDVYVNGALTLPAFQPKSIAGPLQLPAGTYRVQIFGAASSPPPSAPTTGAVIDESLAVPGGANLSLVAHATATGTPALTAFVNDVSSPGATSGRVSVHHTAKAPAVDVTVDGGTAISNLANGEQAAADLPAAAYQVAVRVAPGGPVAIGPVTLHIGAGVLTNLYAISALDGSSLEPIVQTIPTALPPVVPTSSVSVVHGILGVEVDVYVNGELLLAGFAPKAIAGPLQLPVGDYRIQVVPAVASPPATVAPGAGVIDQVVTVPAGGLDLSLVAHLAEDGTPAIGAFVNDISPLAAGDTRISVRHAAMAPVVDVLAGGAPVVEGLANGDAADLDLAAFTGLEVGVALAGTTTVVPGLGPVALSSANGTLTAVYAVSSLATPTTYDLVVQTIPLNRGYRLIAADSGSFTYNTSFLARSTSPSGVVEATSTPSGMGYWTVTASGTLSAYGDAATIAVSGATTGGTVVDLAATPSGAGLYVVDAAGRVSVGGDATHLGDVSSVALRARIVGMEVTPSGQGYWLVGEDGGVFSFGDAAYFGSTGALTLTMPIVEILAAPGGMGYWLVAADGGIFTFGNALFYGSTGAVSLNAPVVDATASPTGRGYSLVASDGGVFAFGESGFYGSAGAVHLNAPVVAAVA